MAKKESRGRQKIKMAKIKNPNHRQVTFSKRRLGLFKKTSEICTLCGIEAVIIVFSPGQRIFSFGHPDVDSLVDRFLSGGLKHKGGAGGGGGSLQQQRQQEVGSSIMRELNSQLTQILDLLEAEKNRGENYDNIRKSSQTQAQCWWEAPIDELGLHELQVLSASMEDLKKNIANQTMFLEKSYSSSTLDIDGGMGVGEDFDLKAIETKFFLPYVDDFQL